MLLGNWLYYKLLIPAGHLVDHIIHLTVSAHLPGTRRDYCGYYMQTQLIPECLTVNLLSLSLSCIPLHMCSMFAVLMLIHSFCITWLPSPFFSLSLSFSPPPPPHPLYGTGWPPYIWHCVKAIVPAMYVCQLIVQVWLGAFHVNMAATYCESVCRV